MSFSVCHSNPPILRTMSGKKPASSLISHEMINSCNIPGKCIDSAVMKSAVNSKGRMPPHRKVLQEAAALQLQGSLPSNPQLSNSAKKPELSLESLNVNEDDYEMAKVPSSSHIKTRRSKDSRDVDRQAVRDLDSWIPKL